MTLPATGETADAERRLAHLPLTFVYRNLYPGVDLRYEGVDGRIKGTYHNGAFDTFYSFQNTTGAVVNGTLTLLNASGTVVTTFDVSIPAGRAGSANTLALGIARNQTGTARFIHDGPPGAVIAEAPIARFSSNPAYVQPVRFQAVREAAH